MSHYFRTPQQPLVTSEFSARVFGRVLTFTTASGVFSGSRLDPGTAVLLDTVPPPYGGHVLDLGCGVGTIAVGLALASPKAVVDAVDINERAVELTRINAARHGVSQRVRAFSPDTAPSTVVYDAIWSNPPIRIGKDKLRELLLRWFARLAPRASAFLVVGKNLGADSLQRWLTDQGYPTHRLSSSKGFRVFESRRAPTDPLSGT